MANPFKNEKEIKLCGETILLRPTFENMANMESKVGSIAHLAFKILGFGEQAKNLIGASELTMIIYYNQAAHDASFGQRPRTIQEIYELVMGEGFFKLIPVIGAYLSGVTKGNKMAPEVSEAEKKS